jgi:hypothetical protein
MPEILVLFLFAAGLWLWFDTLRAREAALAAGRAACERYGLMLLDETVACRSTRPARDDDGRLRLARLYRFEFSDNGNNRREGSVRMLGADAEAVQLEPYAMKLHLVHDAGTHATQVHRHDHEAGR